MASALKNLIRLARRAGRAMVGRDVWDGVEVRRPNVRLGSEYGGWWVVPELLKPSSVVYSFGVGDDISWDLGMIERFGVEVHAFDPTPRCLRWIEKQKLPAKFRFHPLGIADFDGEAQFVMESDDPEWNAYNLSADTSRAREVVKCQVRRLETVCRELGHTAIDVLKMDVEGAEYGALTDILAGPIRPPQLLIEYHYMDAPPERVAQTKASIAALRRAGYRCFARSPAGHEFAFVRES